MSYILSTDEFKNGKMFQAQGKFSHKSGNRFKLFPFVTQTNSQPVTDLSLLVGTFLCIVEGKIVEPLTASELSSALREVTEIESGYDSQFDEMIRQLFFGSNGSLRPINLEFLEQTPSSNLSEKHLAEYLVDVLGDDGFLKTTVEKAIVKTTEKSNVLEKLVLSKLKYSNQPRPAQELHYYRVTDSLKPFFEEDFSYVLSNPTRAKEYLVPLLELYYFTYTSQTILQLNRFLEGDRKTNIPLYFCLEWEKTSQSRSCYTYGWARLQSAVEKIFAHVIVLELLNQTVPGSELVDYIRISEMVQDDNVDSEIAKQIDEITECYRNAITDSQAMNQLKKESSNTGYADASIRYLFKSVQTQFEDTGRKRAYDSYANKFISYCHKYLKSRGRSGLMLNITEETLIFITKICIKDRERVRLKDVFDAFEKRGIFLDDLSKDQVAEYYEKLNLIEKKSDSGDAKYVKRIL